MSRLPLRTRLTVGFTVAMVVVLIVPGLFVYLRVRAHLDEGVDEALSARVEAVVDSASRSTRRSASADPASREDDQEAFVQVLDADGTVLDSAGPPRASTFSLKRLAGAAARHGPVETFVSGIDGPVRVLVKPTPLGPRPPPSDLASDSGGFVVVGQSLEDRNEALSGLLGAFMIGGPIAIVLATLVGYLVTAAALRPMEAMRRRAEALSLDEEDRRLPIPDADDEVRRLGETLNDMLDRLQRSFERERRFVADASHEIRTPIAVIKMELDGALRAGDHETEVREALVAAVEECDRLAQMAEDLLVIARASDGQLPLRPELIHAAKFLESVRERFRDRADEYGRTIAIEASPDLVTWGDAVRLRQALGNLVDNALRHGKGDVVIAARESGAGVELEVVDDGPGFGLDLSTRAFERFTRGNDERTAGGAGLGLSIVHAIAEAHHGEATIIPGRQGCVRLSLPPPPEWSESATEHPAVSTAAR